MSTQEKLEAEMGKYTTGYDSGLEGEESMLRVTRHDKEQDTIVAMYKGKEADIIQALIDSAKREAVADEYRRIIEKVDVFGDENGYMPNSSWKFFFSGRIRELEQSEESI